MKKFIALALIMLMVLAAGCLFSSDEYDDTDNDGTGEDGTTVSGRIVDYYGVGIPGIHVSLDCQDLQTSADTDTLGNYSFADIENESYTVTPTKQGYTLLPESRNVIVSGSNVSVDDFIGSTEGFVGGHGGDRGFCAACH